jgi:hypothetical protein
VRTLLTATALGLLAWGASAQTHVTTRPGPFDGWRSFSGTEDGRPVTGNSRPGPFPGTRETDVNRGGHVTHCTTRPGPFRGQTVTDCP